MNAPPLQVHGQYIAPVYARSQRDPAAWIEKSTDEDRPDGQSTGVVKRYRRHVKLSDRPTSLGLISRAHPEAIRYSPPHDTSGLGLFLAAPGVAWATLVIVAYSMNGSVAVDAAIDFALGLLSLLLLAFMLVIARLALFVPCDQPTIFDRQNRKVYRLFREEPTRMRGLFKPWPMRACEYDWDLLDVEHQTEHVPQRGGGHHLNVLTFVVRRGDGDPTIIDSCQRRSNSDPPSAVVDGVNLTHPGSIHQAVVGAFFAV